MASLPLFGIGGVLLLYLLLATRSPDAKPDGDGYRLVHPWGFRALAWSLPAGLIPLSIGAIFEAESHGRAPSLGSYAFFDLIALAFASLCEASWFGRHVYFDAHGIERRPSKGSGRIQWKDVVSLACRDDRGGDILIGDRKGETLKIPTTVSGMSTFGHFALSLVPARSIDSTTRSLLEKNAAKRPVPEGLSARRAAAAKAPKPAAIAPARDRPTAAPKLQAASAATPPAFPARPAAPPAFPERPAPAPRDDADDSGNGQGP
jgi:hypothetical protein